MLKKLVDKYKDNKAVAFVTLQTVFEGFGTNTAEQAKASADKYDLKIPVGHDPGTNGRRSNVLTRYKTQGTPWMIIIDPRGVVRANDFLIGYDKCVELIDEFAKQAASGAGMIGLPFPDLADATWIHDRKKERNFKKYVLNAVRWWDVTSESETATIKAVIALYKKYRSKKMNLVLAVRSPAEGDACTEEQALAAAKAIKWKGPLILDADGALLGKVREMGYPEAVASPTVLMDWQSEILWVSTADKMTDKDKKDPAAKAAHQKMFKFVRKKLTGK